MTVFVRVLAVMGLAFAVTAPAAPAADRSASLQITITGFKKDKGVVRLALCPRQAQFPDCGNWAVREATLSIHKGQALVVLSSLTPGTYAVSVYHDANNNGSLDTFAGIPKEGYGFSNNPPFRARAPRFEECGVMVAGVVTATIHMRYLL